MAFITLVFSQPPAPLQIVFLKVQCYEDHDLHNPSNLILTPSQLSSAGLTSR